jgi:cyclophilin family peptidyl-prolyl cis-trans isomerase
MPRPSSLLLARLSRCLLSVLLALSQQGLADEASARATMENPGNPLLLITTGAGAVYVEMLADEAPQNVANFIALAEGEIAIYDPISGQSFSPRYYDGMPFHRSVPELLIQAGSPTLNAFGAPPQPLRDEINARALGLDRMPAVLPDGSFNPQLQITDREELEERLLIPLYRAMGIESNREVQQRQFEIDEQLRTLTVQQVYENLGYRYTERFSTRPITRGTLALANDGPDANGPEFFISVAAADWLNGRYTVIGRVVEGMDVVDRINQTATGASSPLGGTLIYSIRRL